MRKLLLWTAVAALTIGSAGCCRGWSWWRRGAPCTTYAYESAPACQSAVIAPPAAAPPVLPGPEVETVPGG